MPGQDEIMLEILKFMEDKAKEVVGDLKKNYH